MLETVYKKFVVELENPNDDLDENFNLGKIVNYQIEMPNNSERISFRGKVIAKEIITNGIFTKIKYTIEIIHN